ncbi:haloacid dehalogenase [Bombiscardovia nodaiensis]|uniref:Haloacid dehalogenase n=1 Tax=Bombiscardovia nodaiensis TaxID=2932181 RepID=A0ABN6SD65_9BIFI|nr:haloacid dehalogenase [Bombiscardovia nodaiensis]
MRNTQQKEYDMSQQRADSAVEGRYQLILFDLYGTLVDIRTDEDSPKPWQALLSFLQGHGYPAQVTASELKAEFETASKEVTHRQQEAWMSAHPGAPLDVSFLEPDLAVAYQHLLGEHGQPSPLVRQAAWLFRQASTLRIGAYPGAQQMLASLRAQGLAVALVSNAQEVYTLPELDLTGLNRSFDLVELSSQVGWRKPAGPMFTRPLEALGVSSGQALMVGNDIGSDILGARAVGIDGAYVHTAISPTQDPQVCQQAVCSLSCEQGVPKYRELLNVVLAPAQV